jgi:transposase
MGLETQPRMGRPRVLTEGYWQALKQTLATEPSHHGYTFTIWTTERLRDHLDQATSIRVNSAYLAEQMKRRG